MPDYDRTEAARRAGITTDELSRMAELGVVHPSGTDRFTAGEVRKAVMVHGLTDAGLPLDGLASVITKGAISLDFMDTPAYERFSALGDETFAQVAARTGVPVELLMVIREVTGGAMPSPDDWMAEPELAIVPFLEAQVREGFRPAAVERYLRAQGENLRRITESEAEWWRSEVIMPGVAKGLTADEIASPRLAEYLTELMERALLDNYHVQQARAWMANIVEGFELILAQNGIEGRVEHPPAMCFLDITGYTRLTDERGDEAAAEVAAELGRLVQRSSVSHGGKAVKWLGDGVMFWFRDPGPGVVAALEMCDGVRGAGLPPAHVGLHAGPVVVQQGDYYGQTVNVASRIADYARPGEVLVSAAVVEASPQTPGVAYSEIGPVELKGVSGPIHLLAARRA